MVVRRGLPRKVLTRNPLRVFLRNTGISSSKSILSTTAQNTTKQCRKCWTAATRKRWALYNTVSTASGTILSALNENPYCTGYFFTDTNDIRETKSFHAVLPKTHDRSDVTAVPSMLDKRTILQRDYIPFSQSSTRSSRSARSTVPDWSISAHWQSTLASQSVSPK